MSEDMRGYVIEPDSDHQSLIGSSSSQHGGSPRLQNESLPLPKRQRKQSVANLIFWVSSLLNRITGLFSLVDDAEDERFDDCRPEKINDYRLGYPQFAAYINADPNFHVFRRFGTLRNRLLLQCQHELNILEERLGELDEKDFREHPKRLKSVRKDCEEDSEGRRRALLEEIDRKLAKYDELLERQQKSIAMAKPSKRNYHSIINYVWNEKPLLRSEIQYLNRSDDFVVLTPDQDSPFSSFIERLIGKVNSPVLKALFIGEERQLKTDDPSIRLFSKARIDYLVRAVVTICSVILLMIPVTLLCELDPNEHARISIVFFACLLFPAAVSIFARPKNHELFTATAAYCAVLVVFLGNLSVKTSDKNVKST